MRIIAFFQIIPMSYKILDGKKASQEIKEELKQMVEEQVQAGGKRPHLAAILVGDDGASKTYVNAKSKACEASGFESSTLRFEDTISEDELLKEIDKLNKDDSVDGFIVQLPLPDHIDSDKVLKAVSPEKDVDGFHPINVGKMTLGLPTFLSATPYGVMMLLEKNNIDTTGKHCVIVGNSNIVGTPMTLLLNRMGRATTTNCHIDTIDLPYYTKQADVLVVAVGKPGMIKADMVKEGAVVVDVGITRVEDNTRERGYRLAGDVDFENVAPKCSWITPVPGGVGPMTIAGLMKNTFFAAQGKKATTEV